MTVLQQGDPDHRLPPWPLPPAAADGGPETQPVHQVLHVRHRLDWLQVLRGPRGKLLAGVIALVVGGTGLTACTSGAAGPGPAGPGTGTAGGSGSSPAPGGAYRVDTGLRLLTPMPRPEPGLRALLRTGSDLALLAARLRADGDPAAARRLLDSLAGPPPSGEAYVVSVLALHSRPPNGAQLWREDGRLTVRPIGGSGVQCLGSPAASTGELPGGYALVAFTAPVARVPAGALVDGEPFQPPSTGRITSSPVH
jgi:hypothetical protein